MTAATDQFLFQTQVFLASEGLVSFNSITHAEVRLSWKNFIPGIFSQSLITRLTS